MLKVFLLVIRLSSVNIIPPCLHSHISPGNRFTSRPDYFRTVMIFSFLYGIK
jgi:hypothetical protein